MILASYNRLVNPAKNTVIISRRNTEHAEKDQSWYHEI